MPPVRIASRIAWIVPPAISRCRSSVFSISRTGISTPRMRVSVSGSCTDCRYSGVWTRSRFRSEAGRGSDSRRLASRPASSSAPSTLSPRSGSIGTPLMLC